MKLVLKSAARWDSQGLFRLAFSAMKQPVIAALGTVVAADVGDIPPFEPGQALRRSAGMTGIPGLNRPV